MTNEVVGCRKCGKPMPAERLEFGYPDCMGCTPQAKPKGVMVYSHKTGGVLDITTDEGVFQALKGSADDGVERL